MSPGVRLLNAADDRSCKVEPACRGRAVVIVKGAPPAQVKSCQYHARQAVQDMLRKTGRVSTKRIGQLGGLNVQIGQQA
jgi:hypothetical protein